MNLPIDELCDLLRTFTEPEKGVDDLLALCDEHAPSPLWKALTPPTVQRDVDDFFRFLSEEIEERSVRQRINGIYLGLDTLNMGDFDGFNLEVGFSSDCEPRKSDLQWIYSLGPYRRDYLIESLFDWRNDYMKDCWGDRIQQFADYVLFFGYAGIVALSALSRINLPTPSLCAFGFHDGDMLVLLRNLKQGQERVLEWT